VEFGGRNIVERYRRRVREGELVPGWMAVSTLAIIEQSAVELLALTHERGWEQVVLPRPGCGAGELSWELVRAKLQEVLDDRFVAITF